MRSIRKNRVNRRGNRVGIWEFYYSNGNISSKGLYVNGKEEGIWEIYYSNGNIDAKGLYVDGNREGIWESYWSNGNLFRIGSYKEGLLDGLRNLVETSGCLSGSRKTGAIVTGKQ